jgi:succinoglycan biosynthesis transport protein ExoP
VNQAGDAPELNLDRFLAAVRRRKATIAAITIGMLASALVLSFLQTPVYQAEARIALDPPGGTTVFEPLTAAARIDPALVIDTEIEVLEGQRVQSEVREELGQVSEVEASRVGDTLLIQVNGSAEEPARAAAVTNAYIRAYLDLRREQASADLLSTGQELRTKVSELQSQITSLDPAIGAEQREALVQQQARFSERLNELEIEAALTSGGAQLMSEALVPTEAVSPRPVRNGALATVVGLMLGLGVVLFREYRDDTIKTREDLAGVVQPLPVLASIPFVNLRQEPVSRPRIATGTDGSPAAEAYRALRTAVRLLGVERALRTIQLTSALPGDGKTTTVANLGVVLASAGARVVLVDCDLRRPSLHGAFDLTNAQGFTSVLAGEIPLADAIQGVPGQPNLALLPAGASPPNPSELLGSKLTSELLYSLQSEFDMVLVDSPPVLLVTDASVLSLWVDATLLVAASRLTTRSHLGRTLEVLRQTEAPVRGAILNRVDAEPGYGYYGGQTEEQSTPLRLSREHQPSMSGDDIGTFDWRSEE